MSDLISQLEAVVGTAETLLAWLDGMEIPFKDRHRPLHALHGSLSSLPPDWKERLLTRPSVEDCSDPWECCVHTPDEYERVSPKGEEG